MKVIELIKLLSKYDQNLEVFCYSEDSNLLKDNQGFILLDIESVDMTEATKVRFQDGTPTLKLGKDEHSEIFITLNATSVF